MREFGSRLPESPLNLSSVVIVLSMMSMYDLPSLIHTKTYLDLLKHFKTGEKMNFPLSYGLLSRQTLKNFCECSLTWGPSTAATEIGRIQGFFSVAAGSTKLSVSPFSSSFWSLSRNNF